MRTKGLPDGAWLCLAMAALTGFCMTAGAACVTAPSGLVSWWAGEGTANDVLGVNPGVLTNGTTFTAGKVGSGFSFTNSNSRVDAGTTGMNVGTNDFTIDGWAQTSATKTWNTLVSFDAYRPALYVTGNGSLQLYPASASSAAGLNDGQFHHFAAVRQSGVVTYYKDGAAIGTVNYADALAPQQFHIGDDLYGGDQFAGVIDEVDFFNRALSASEVQAIFAAGSAGKCPPSGPGSGTYTLSRIELNRTFIASWLAAASTRPLQETNGPGQQTFELGWNFKWPDPTGPNWNIATSIVTLAQAPTVVTPGTTATFVATMTGHWDTTGYGIDRDHTISLSGVAGTNQYSNVGNPSSVQDGQFNTTNTITVPAATGSEIALTLDAGLRFGGDHTGSMEIKLVYSSLPVTKLTLSRIELNRTFIASWLAAASTRPLQETNGPGQQTFELGWNFKWPDPTGPNWNIATSIVTLAQAPTVVTPGATATFVATMTGHWDTTGYGIDRDHTISLSGVAGTNQFVNWGSPSSVQDGQFGTTNTITVPAATGSEIALTLDAGLRFGGDHTGSMEIKLVYSNATSSCVSAPAGLVAWWPGGGDATDLLGRHSGTTHAVTPATGEVGQSWKFDGSSSFVDVPDSSDWNFGLGDFSIELWANFQSGSGAFLAHDTGPGAVNKWIFWLSGGALTLHLNGVSGEQYIGRVAFSPQTGQWYHLALTRSSTNYYFYVNGQLLGHDAYAGGIPAATASLTIGDAEGNFFFNGQLDEVSIYNRALSPAEIASLYSAGSAGKCPPSLTITRLPRLEIHSVDAANWEVSWASSAQVYHLETTDSLTPPVQWSPLNIVSTSVGGREITHVPKAAKNAVYIRARTEGTVLSEPPYVSGIRSLSAIAALDGSGTAVEYQGQICTNLQDFQDSLAAWGSALDNLGTQANAALAGALQGTGLQGFTSSGTRGGALRRVQPQDSGFVPGPLTDIINQFKQVKQTVDDLKKLKGKLQLGAEILSWITQNKSFDEIVSAHSSFFSQISGIFRQMRADVEVPLGEIIDGKNAGKPDDMTDFNDLVAFVSSNDVQLAESMRTPNFTLASYQNLPLTDRQRDLVAQAFRSSTLRGRLYLRDNLMPFLKTLASAGVETYADAIFDATGAKKGANVFKSALEYSQKIYAFLSDKSPTPPTPLKFDCRRRFLRTDDPDSDVKADLFLVAKLADGSTRLATFLVSGSNVISEGGDLLLTQGLPVPALVYDILVVPRDQASEPIKLLPLATEVDANLTTFVDLPVVSGTRLTVRPDPKSRDTTGQLQPATLSLDQIQDFDVHVDGFPQTADGPVRGLYSTETRPDGTTSPSFLVPFLPPNLPLTLGITSTNIEAFSQSITIGNAQQEFAAPVVVVPPPASTNSDFWAKVSWTLRDYGDAVVASGTGTNFSVSLTNTVYVPGGARTNVVFNITASIAASPISYGQPFDVTCTMGGTAQGSAPVTVSLWISTANITKLPDTPLPTSLTLKAAFRPLSSTSANLYKADFVGSIPFVGHGTKTFLSADVPFEGFAGNFYLEAGQGAICMANGVICFAGNIMSGDTSISANYVPYTLHATVRTWPTGLP